jgi:hypothetical protein
MKSASVPDIRRIGVAPRSWAARSIPWQETLPSGLRDQDEASLGYVAEEVTIVDRVVVATRLTRLNTIPAHPEQAGRSRRAVSTEAPIAPVVPSGGDIDACESRHVGLPPPKASP